MDFRGVLIQTLDKYFTPCFFDFFFKCVIISTNSCNVGCFSGLSRSCIIILLRPSNLLSFSALECEGLRLRGYSATSHICIKRRSDTVSRAYHLTAQNR